MKFQTLLRQLDYIMQQYKKNSMKSISTINPAIMEDMQCLIIEECAPFIDLKVGVSLNHDVSLRFHFASSF